MSPLTAEFGWSRAAISAGFSLRSEVGGLAAPAVGFLLDKWGPRVLMLTGIVLVAIGFFLFSQTQTLVWFYGAVIVIAIGMSATGGATGNVLVAHWFRRKRGRAMGLMTLGGGTGGIMAIVFAWLVSNFGWRDSLIFIGVAQLLICLPLVLTIRNRPADMGLSPDGIPEPETADGAEQAAANADRAGLTSKEALRSIVFWKLSIAMALNNFATTAIIVHQVPFLEESVGMSEGAAAATVTTMTAISIAGRIGLGAAADVIAKKHIMAISLLCVAVALVSFASVTQPWQLAYALPLFGLGFGGGIPVRPALQAEYFGLKAFGAIQGLVLTVMTIGGFIGPVLAGYIYDVSDSYRTSFLILALGPLVAIPLLLSIRSGPVEVASEATASA